MQIERLILKNFRGIREMDLAFHPKLTVLAGPNGAGKSSILDAIAGLLARCLNRINKNTGRPAAFAATDCTYGSSQSQCVIHVRASSKGSPFVWGVRMGPAIPHPDWDVVVDGNRKQGDERLAAAIRDKAGPEEPDPSLESFGEEAPAAPAAAEWQPHLPVFLLLTPDRALQPESERGIPESHQEALPFERKYPMASVYRYALGSHKRFHWLVQWFKDREEIEVRGLRNISHNMLHKLRLEGQLPEGIDPQLEAVRAGIEKFTGLRSPRFHGDPLRFVASKGDALLPITSFSEGEKVMFAVVGDLARRLAIANPKLRLPLEGEGVVMIDEIELHLHPSWQRAVIPRLIETFPNIQFIITTHSPQVLGEIHSENIVLLEETGPGGILDRRFSQEVHGMTSSHILEAVMETPERPRAIAEAVREAFVAIERNDLAKAKTVLADLYADAKDIPELERIGMRIRRKEATGK